MMENIPAPQESLRMSIMDPGWIKLPGPSGSTFFNLRYLSKLILLKQREEHKEASLHSISSRIWKLLVKYSGTEKVWNSLESCRKWWGSLG